MSRFAFVMAVTDSLSCCCTVTHGPIQPGIASRRCWRTTSPPSTTRSGSPTWRSWTASPSWEALERVDAAFAESWGHWFFFASPHAHRVITADPLAWYRPDRDRMGLENYDDMVAAVLNPDTVMAMIEDYRASLHVDRAIDQADRSAGRQIRCPTLVAWSAHDDMAALYGDPAQVWRPWCAGRLHSATIDSGHHMAEEAPAQLASTLKDFLLT